MKVLAFLQNQWFKDPDKVKRMLERAPTDEHRHKLRRNIIRYSLFAGCLTGRRLKRHFGETACDAIIWEEASPEIGGKASSCFGFDVPHITHAIKAERPDIILTFGRVALDGVRAVNHGVTRVIAGPHPANRSAVTCLQLTEMAERLTSATLGKL